MIASIAPSDAPAETPSVSGEASGLRSSAWKTTPDERERAADERRGETRGSRATKKICASMLSANGIERSKTAPRRIGVLPTSGASRQRDRRERAEGGERPDGDARRRDRPIALTAIGQSAPPSDGRRAAWNCTSASTP